MKESVFLLPGLHWGEDCEVRVGHLCASSMALRLSPATAKGVEEARWPEIMCWLSRSKPCIPQCKQSLPTYLPPHPPRTNFLTFWRPELRQSPDATPSEPQLPLNATGRVQPLSASKKSCSSYPPSLGQPNIHLLPQRAVKESGRSLADQQALQPGALPCLPDLLPSGVLGSPIQRCRHNPGTAHRDLAAVTICAEPAA